ncbi:MAG: DUF1840 domain-containing protein [Thiobacillus sp.]
MLVTFTTKAYADITMFGDVALPLLRMMGHSGTVPGAIVAADVPAALDRLRGALDAVKSAPADIPEAGDEEQGRPVSLAHRALPLLELLAAAARQQADVMWR